MGNKIPLIKSIEKTIAVLACLEAEKRPMSLKDISEKTHIAKSTVYGFLYTLRVNGVIDQSNEDGKYFIPNQRISCLNKKSGTEKN